MEAVRRINIFCVAKLAQLPIDPVTSPAKLVFLTAIYPRCLKSRWKLDILSTTYHDLYIYPG